MSEKHTQGRLAVKHVWIVPEDHRERPIGGSTDKQKDRDHYANVVATVEHKYHDNAANIRRLVDCWNAFDGISPPLVACIVENGGVKLILETASNNEKELAAVRARIAELDAQLGKRPCQNNRCTELAAARALLREVVTDHDNKLIDDMCASQKAIPSNPFVERIRSYLDAAEALG